jgi:leucyl aminopeptidase
MELRAKAGDILKERSDAAVFTAFENEGPRGLLADADKMLGGVISRAFKTGEFTGKADEVIFFHTGSALKGGPERVVVAGLGKKDKLRKDLVMRAAGSSAAALRRLNLKDITVAEDIAPPDMSLTDAANLWVQGAILGLYSFDTFKAPDPKKKELRRMTFIARDRKAEGQARAGADTGKAIADSVCVARDMINTPANEMTPTVMAAVAKKIAREFGLKIKVLEEKDCRKLGMGAFLGVAAGSTQPPKFIVMEYGRARKRPVVLVGKGITFDSGGISIKPVDGMEKMKYDMAGGAAVLGVMRAVAALKLPVNVVAVVPVTENMPDGGALKPGDVVRAMNGKTIEIISTDAEGRLILADGLCYAQRYKPSAVIDIATLTGACVIALGDQAVGMMGNDPALMASVRRAGDAVHERVWELPMWDEYLERMRGDVTDLKNAAGRQAATVTAGKFLEEFVGGTTPWVHLDIAGTAWEEKGRPYVPKGAIGTGVRLLTEFLMGSTD